MDHNDLLEVETLTADAALADLCMRYWLLMPDQAAPVWVWRAAALAKELQVPAGRLAGAIARYCVARSQQIRCSRCGAPYIFSSRADFQQMYRGTASWLCTTCQESEQAQARAQQAAEEERQRNYLRERYSLDRRKPIDVEDLSFADAVYLLSLIRAGATEDLHHLGPLNPVFQVRPLSPTREYDWEIVIGLLEHELLHIHPDSPMSAFLFEEGTDFRYYPYQVWYALPITTGSDAPTSLMTEIEESFRMGHWPEAWYEEWLPLWQRVALEECLQYLYFTLEEHRLPFKAGDKTRQMFQGLLTEFSVAQVYNLIWRAARDAAAFWVREQVPKQHAANTVVGSIQRQADRARSERWEVKGFRRDYRCPQSMVSQILCDTALHLGTGGFEQPPQADALDTREEEHAEPPDNEAHDPSE